MEERWAARIQSSRYPGIDHTASQGTTKRAWWMRSGRKSGSVKVRGF